MRTEPPVGQDGIFLPVREARVTGLFRLPGGQLSLSQLQECQGIDRHDHPAKSLICSSFLQWSLGKFARFVPELNVAPRAARRIGFD